MKQLQIESSPLKVALVVELMLLDTWRRQEEGQEAGAASTNNTCNTIIKINKKEKSFQHKASPYGI